MLWIVRAVDEDSLCHRTTCAIFVDYFGKSLFGVDLSFDRFKQGILDDSHVLLTIVS